MPLFAGMEASIREHLALLSAGQRVPVIVIGYFTDTQFVSINEGRAAQDMHLLEQNEILFMGRHLHTSRAKDGYNIDDIVAQIMSGLSAEAVAHIDSFVSYTQNPIARNDGYGNQVHDRAVFEMTARKPRAELYSVIPKGDSIKPTKKATP